VPGGIAETAITRNVSTYRDLQGDPDIPGAIATILANKYKGGPTTPDPDRVLFKNALGVCQGNIQKAMTQNAGDISMFKFVLRGAMPVFAGGLARQDKDLISVIPTLHEAIGQETAEAGMAAARALELLVLEKPYLRTETHAIVRPLYKQWAYANVVKPMYPLALPVSQAVPQAKNYTVAILSILKHCAFAVYEDDVQDIIRMLMASLSEMLTSRSSDAHAALKVLQDILRNDHQALKDHLTAVIDNVVKAVQRPSEGTTAAPVVCRKIGVQILAELPAKFEEQYLLRYSLRINRLLTESCGDPVREVRRAAIVARESWAKVV
jgi:DNA repair/transcription protein MET18/MMS19